MKMTGNTILITGGASGIGRALAAAFHAEGNQVIIASRRKTALDDTAASYPGMKAEVLDVSDRDAIPPFSERVTRAFPKLNVVIHNAGIMRLEPLRGGALADAEAMVATNLLGPMRLTAALLPHLERQPHAAIMTVTSGVAFMPTASTPVYCATKAALHSYTQSLRYQLKDSTVQVHELIPPYVQTELMGPEHANAPGAMPLATFVAEVFNILKATPEIAEICVKRVKPLRFAERNGVFDEFFEKFNDAISAAKVAE